MSKTLFTAALAFVLSIGGFVMSAQAQEAQNQTVSEPSAEAGLWQLVVSAKDETLLNKGLKAIAVNSNEKSFGYKVGGKFISLSDAMVGAPSAADGDKVSATLELGSFNPTEQLQFGYGDENSFDAISGLKISSDAGFHAGYNIDSFYKLDFTKDPFDGKIEIYVLGEPLPASTVTLLVALAAAAGLLLYNNRRTRARFSAQA